MGYLVPTGRLVPMRHLVPTGRLIPTGCLIHPDRTSLFARMSAQELLTGVLSKEWVDDLPKIVRALNRKTSAVKPRADKPIASGESAELIPEGTKVRVALDNPKNYTDNKQLNGRFRTTDLRWDDTVRTIKQVVITAGQPPLYLLNGTSGKYKIEPIGYTRNQLQVIDRKEKYPPHSVIRGDNDKYIVQKLVDRKKENGKVFYQVKWRGYPTSQSTWEPRSVLIREIPYDIRDFEFKLNK